MGKINFKRNEKHYQIDYKENLAVAIKMFEEISMDMNSDSALMDELQQVDLMEQDVLHMIEFHTFNASEGYTLAKMLQEIRNERRNIKNRIEERRKARHIVENIYKGMKIQLRDNLKSIEGLNDRQSARKYRIRALPQLEGFNKLINAKKIDLK